MPHSNAQNKDASSETSSEADNYNYNNSSSASELEVFLKRKCHPINAQSLRSNAKMNSIGMKLIKNTPPLFFVVFLIVIAILLMPFTNNLTFQKPINSFNSSIESNYLKLLILVSQAAFLLICGCLFTIINQRMSVPEHKTSKASNVGFAVFSVLTVITATLLSIYNQETVTISIALGLSDNLFNCFFMVFATMTSLFSFVSLMAFEGNYNSYYSHMDIPLIEWVMTIKKVCIILMEAFLVSCKSLYHPIYSVLDIISVVLASVYPHHNDNDKIFVSWLIVAYSISSIAFLISFAFYILSLRFDLSYIYSLLQFKPDIEYFFDESLGLDEHQNKLASML